MAEDELEPLITECPNCRTRFRVTETQLQVAGGRVRCGACLTVFHGVDHLLWDGRDELGSDTRRRTCSMRCSKNSRVLSSGQAASSDLPDAHGKPPAAWSPRKTRPVGLSTG